MAKFNPISYYQNYCKKHNIQASPQKLAYWFYHENVPTKVKNKRIPNYRTLQPVLCYEKTEAIVVIDTYLRDA